MDDKDFLGNHEVFIVDLVTLEKLQLQYMPLGLNYDPESNFVAIQSMGRNNPIYHFTGSEDTLTFDITFTATSETRDDVLKRVKWLEALTKADAYNAPPHKIKFLFGELFTEAVWIMRKVSPEFSLFHKAFGLKPTLARVGLTMVRDTETNRTRADILNLKT